MSTAKLNYDSNEIDDDDEMSDLDDNSHARSKSPTQNKNLSNTHSVTFIIPFATPGSGKSFCWDAIKKHLRGLQGSWSFQSVSSDEVRGELMQEIMH